MVSELSAGVGPSRRSLGAVERPGGGAGVDLAQRRQGLSVSAVDGGVPDAVTVTDVVAQSPLVAVGARSRCCHGLRVTQTTGQC